MVPNATFLRVLLLALPMLGNAYMMKNFPITVKQPDNTELHLFVSGNEVHNWFHDSSNYTIIRNREGEYVYGVLNEGDVVPSSYVVGNVDPAKVGLVPGINLSPEVLAEKIKAYEASGRGDRHTADNLRLDATGGRFGSNLNQLVIFIRFSDQGAFTKPLSTFDTNLNSLTSVSVRGYYKEVSHSQIDVYSYFFPTQSGTTIVAYNHDKPRTYYQKDTPDGYANGNPSSTDREHGLLADAVTAVQNMVPKNINLDVDNDGNVDNVVFIIQGNTDGWGDLLWPHRWSLFTKNVSINGKRVLDYNLDFEGGSGAGVLSHELFHTFGAPDLYRYTNTNIEPVGSWDVMSGGDWNTPQHMTVYYKQKFGGWVSDIPTLTQAGTYTLEPVSKNPFSAYKINIPNSTRGEFIVLEYRKQEGLYDKIVPSQGILIYRVTPDLNGNGDGPDDEIYVYRPGGTKNINGDINKAPFSSTNNLTWFDDVSNPAFFMTNENAGGFPKGLGISNVTAIGETISFDFKGGSGNNPTVSITSPSDNDTLVPPATFDILATASTPTGTISKVDFYNGTTFLGSDNTSPYSFNWKNVVAGSYTLSAKVTDSQGGTALSRPVAIVVQKPICTVAGSKLSGTVIGTDGSWSNEGDVRDKAFDGNTSTFFDAPMEDGAWVGLDLGSPKTVLNIRYYPRVGFPARMTGGKFQGSTTADFSSGVVDLYAIATQPDNLAWTCLSLSNTSSYRYIRYLSPDGGSANVAEVEFYEQTKIVIPPVKHGHTYAIKVDHTGKVCGLADNVLGDGAQTEQLMYQDDPSLKWVAFDVGNGYWKFINVASVKALGVSDSSVANGGLIQQHAYSGSSWQQWQLLASDTTGYYKVVNKGSGKVMDVIGVSQQEGATIWQWEYVGGNNQKWAFQEVLPVTDGQLYALEAKHDGKVLEVKDAATSNESPVVQMDNQHTKNQAWKAANIGNLLATFTNANSKKSLEIVPNSTVNGGLAQQADYTGNDWQKWSILGVEEGYFEMINLGSSLALDVIGSSQDNGATVWQWTYLSGNNQKWKFEETNPTVTGVQDLDILETHVHAAPNPFLYGFRLLTKEPVWTEIYSLTGDKLLEENVTSDKLLGINLKSGTYLLKVTSGNTVQNQLIVKQ